MPDPTDASKKVCVCEPGFSGTSCNIPVTSVTSGPTLSVSVPGKSWRYFEASIPFTPGVVVDSRVMVEMTKPGGSLSLLQPVLQVAPVETMLPGNSSFDWDGFPVVSNIDPSSFILTEACTCNDCPCYIPYQAEALQYEALRIQNTSNSKIWIAVFNNAPWTGANSPPVQLR